MTSAVCAPARLRTRPDTTASHSNPDRVFSGDDTGSNQLPIVLAFALPYFNHCTYHTAGRTALHEAAAAGRVEAAAWLLDRGAKMEKTTALGRQTPLHLAARCVSQWHSHSETSLYCRSEYHRSRNTAAFFAGCQNTSVPVSAIPQVAQHRRFSRAAQGGGI
jgi:Ankyrin repeats (many copies)